MATLKQIRGRIKAAKNIQQITRAMKLVAAARFKRATDRVVEARPYADKMRSFMESLASGGSLPDHPLMARRPVKKYCVIIIAADRGLAGSYNTGLLRKTVDFMKETPGEGSLIAVGKKAFQFFNRRNYTIRHSQNLGSAGARLEDAVVVTRVARQLFESGEVDAIYLCYAKFFSAIRQVPTIIPLLPIEPPQQASGAAEETNFDFEPSAEKILETLLPRYLMTLIWQAMLESTASFFGAQMTAMTSATDNAGKMINTLTIRANRERQAAITKEILEVVGGAEALKS
ncbi:MAG: F-type H+-transporting ATPase subunit gamma [Fimbriimonadaceae bacterium]|jgi:F-type H+-transporting ATPase subunit gamma|nr:F-type H+-transporting ATPase subunit gamma [Fimbriimonadaceae bacterium]